MLNYSGHFRLYFNRAADAPYVWAIDGGDHAWEISITGFTITAHPVTNCEDLAAEWPHPKAWLQGVAKISIDGRGHALITPQGDEP
jgi:hypothetical protein